jgi:hypothetical protein
MSRPLTWLAAALRRWWWIAALVTIVTLCLAVYGYASTRPIYVATQHLTVVLLPPGAATATEVARTEQDEQTIARLLAHGGIFASPPLDAAIASQLAAHGGQGAGITAKDIASAVTATHAGNIVTLSARWREPGGARALVTAVAAALGGGALLPAVTQAGVLPPGASLRVEADGPPARPVVDQAVAGTARALLLGRLALGVGTGLVLAFGTELLHMRALVARSAR